MLTVRRAEEGDIAAIAAMERAVFSDAWSADTVRDTLHASYTLPLVATRDGEDEPVGYLIATVLPPEAELLRLAAHPVHRRCGIGHRLVDAFLSETEESGCDTHLLEVRARNSAAISLYEAAGFRTVGVRAAYYRHPTEDAVLMRRDALPSPKA